MWVTTAAGTCASCHQEWAQLAVVLVPGAHHLPRGGVPVAYEIAQVLGAPLDIIVVRKLGIPG